MKLRLFFVSFLITASAGAQSVTPHTNARTCHISGDKPVKIYQEYPEEFGTTSIEDFGVVVPGGIYRGSRPHRAQDFEFLKKLGVKNILTLELASLDYKREERNAGPSGIHIQVDSLQASPFRPSQKSVNRVLDYLRDQSNWPVYVHCNFGHHRTGMVLALYRLLEEGCSKEATEQELRNFGYSPKYFFTYGLRSYLHAHTPKPSDGN